MSKKGFMRLQHSLFLMQQITTLLSFKGQARGRIESKIQSIQLLNKGLIFTNKGLQQWDYHEKWVDTVYNKYCHHEIKKKNMLAKNDEPIHMIDLIKQTI